MNRFERAYGALLGLAVGDAIGFPALFHRIFALPERRRPRLWDNNRTLTAQRIGRLYLPYTHREPSALLAPAPGDDTEWALLSARALLDETAQPTQQSFLNAWRQYVLSVPADQLVTGFSERAAIENLRRGLLPPATGNDNPQHYEDCAAVRAVISGLYYAGNPDAAAQLAQADAEISNAADGVYAARAMAVAIALLIEKVSLADALNAARQQFPSDSWIAHNDTIARACLRESASLLELTLHLARRISNTLYTFGNVAPETLPAAFALYEAAQGDMQQAVLAANAIPKATDSLPALVGALCGAHGGAEVVPAAWRAAVNTVRGLCLPSLAALQLDEITQALIKKVEVSRARAGEGM